MVVSMTFFNYSYCELYFTLSGFTLEDCRRYMRENYGCKSGHGTPIHVTLVPPFHLPEEYTTQDLVQVMELEVCS